MSIIRSPSEGDRKTLLLVTGGLAESNQALSDAWLLCIGDGVSWREVSTLKEE